MGGWTLRAGLGAKSALSLHSRPEHPADFDALITDPDRRRELAMTDLDQRWTVAADDEGLLLGGGIATFDGCWVGLSGIETLEGPVEGA